MSTPMIRLVKVKCRYGEVKPLNGLDTSMEFVKPKFKKLHVVEGCVDTQLQKLINIFLMHKASTNKDIGSISRALFIWLTWLEVEGLDAFTPHILHYKSPTYAFKEYLLIRIHDVKDLSHSTANSYLNAIKNFYVFLDGNKILPLEGFFKHELSMTRRGTVSSTDLRIKKINNHESSLNPLKQRDVDRLLEVIELMPDRDKLLISLLLGCGLRGQEARTMNALLFNEDTLIESDSFLIQDIIIGNKTGVETKFLIDRELFITKPLYEQVLDYIDSKDYQNSLSKYKAKFTYDSKYLPLFLTNNGNLLNKQAYYNIWNKFKELYKREYKTEFKHKPHDLRATFGTSLLQILSKETGDVLAALGVVKVALGHKDESQTLKYAKYLTHSKMLNRAAQILDEHAVKIFKGGKNA